MSINPRDSLKEIWKLRSPWTVRRALRNWCEMAEESGIGPLQRFAASLKSHRRGIVAHVAYPIHTGRLEGVNNKIKVIKRRSYGFRDPTYFTLKVKQALPGRSPPYPVVRPVLDLAAPRPAGRSCWPGSTAPGRWSVPSAASRCS